MAPRPFRFPADHGPHPEFRTEWWYFVGNLEAAAEAGPAAERRLGFQLTLFRTLLRPDPPVRESPWGTGQVYMGHFAVSDLGADDGSGGRFFAFERFSRGAAGLAGAAVDAGGELAVWIEDWRIEGSELSTDGTATFRIAAASDGVAVDLTLRAAKPPVLQGDRGLSQKGPEPGNASYYYSYTRLEAEGTVTVPAAGQSEAASAPGLGQGRATALPVTGSAWLDREWSTSALGPEQVGWDWFALQLDGNTPSGARELMLYQLRNRDGSAAAQSSGSLAGSSGEPVILDRGDFTIEVLECWRSPTGAVYPAGWRIELPAEGLRLTVEPLLADQEHTGTFRYWEGAVAVRGEGPAGPVAGRGFVELTGY